jgi:hypothetical protein
MFWTLAEMKGLDEGLSEWRYIETSPNDMRP